LTAKHAGPLGTTFLNRYVQWLRQAALGVTLPEPKPDDDGRARLMVRDKCMQVKNNYDLGLRGVMNGTQGVVVATEPNLVVKYPDEEAQYTREDAADVQLAYVITPHKAQGSEWPCAVVVVPKAHAFMQSRGWFYTAATRARKTCAIVGDPEGARRAVQKVETDSRDTLLSVFARHPEARPL
jgi:exodeoxyribonuclease V alpha subunit